MTLLHQRIGMVTNQPTPGFLTNTTMPPQAVWAYSSGCSLRGPLTCATSIHRSPPCWLAPPKRPTPSVLASSNRQRSQTTQPWTSLCITASIGSSFLSTHRGNGYALRACHQMMMMMTPLHCVWWCVMLSSAHKAVKFWNVGIEIVVTNFFKTFVDITTLCNIRLGKWDCNKF